MSFRSVPVFGGLLLGLMSSCLPMPAEPEPGPDKQAIGTYYGAALGATSGAVTGFQVASAAGPGAWVGAGFGSIFGMLSGLGMDSLEDDELARAEEAERLRCKLWTQEVLAEQYARRLELHPSRDIWPADVFFQPDSVKLRPEARLLLQEIGQKTKSRVPWSRIVVLAYVTSRDEESTYANYLTERRAQAIALQLVRAGLNPERLSTKSVTLPEPLVLDPHDSPNRYRQAIEFLALDR